MQDGKKTTEEQLAQATELLEKAKATIKEQQAVIDSIVPPEAVYSFSTNALSRDGLPGTWTIRARVGEAGASFYARTDNFVQSLIKHGWQVPQRPPQTQSAPASVAAPAPTNGAHVAPPQAVAPSAANGESGQTFPCKYLLANVEGGKSYWKIKGGRFEKFGVTVYPEVLTAAGFATLDPLMQYDLTGYVATYALKEDGKPAKVTALAKAV